MKLNSSFCVSSCVRASAFEETLLYWAVNMRNISSYVSADTEAKYSCWRTVVRHKLRNKRKSTVSLVQIYTDLYISVFLPLAANPFSCETLVFFLSQCIRQVSAGALYRLIVPCPSRASVKASLALPNPSSRHTTVAALMLQLSSHTVPHSPFFSTSTLPSPILAPPFRRTRGCCSKQSTTNRSCRIGSECRRGADLFRQHQHRRRHHHHHHPRL